MDDRIIEERKNGREQAGALVAMLSDCGLTDEGLRSAWRYLQQRSVEAVGLIVPVPSPGDEAPFTDVEAERWATHETMAYTRYFGQRLIDVPLGFLWHVHDKQTNFLRQLRRYLLSPNARRQYDLERQHDQQEDEDDG